MSHCELCNGRIMQSDTGPRCMNKACKNNTGIGNGEQMCDKCQEPLHYSGLNSYGEPNYHCLNCGARQTVKG